MHMLEAILLGLIQGASEFLPISSSGHLVVAQHLFGFQEAPISFDILLHFGTFLATIVVLRSRMVELVKAIPRLPRFGQKLFSKGHLAIAEDLPSWTLLLIVVTTFVTGSLGLLFQKRLKAAFDSLPTVAVALAVTALFLFFTKGRGAGKSRSAARMKIADALWIGLAQAVAILPGISRSGATISTGLYRGLDRGLAGEYAFLISLPAILGAMLLEAKDGFSSLGFSLPAAALGFLSAFLVGMGALHLLLRWVRSGQLHWFAIYCLAMSLFTAYLAWF